MQVTNFFKYNFPTLRKILKRVMDILQIILSTNHIIQTYIFLGQIHLSKELLLVVGRT